MRRAYAKSVPNRRPRRKRLQSAAARGGDDLASLTLYHGWRSSASRRVRLCLAEKGLTFDSKTIDLLKSKALTPKSHNVSLRGIEREVLVYAIP